MTTPSDVKPGQETVGARALHGDGYRAIFPIELRDGDFDAQNHLNNSVVARLFNDLRISYVKTFIGERWLTHLRNESLVVAARELHILYESEGLPDESFIGAVRYVRREGKAAIMEHRVVEAATGRGVARGWVVQLLVRSGSVIEFPEWYYGCAAAVEERTITTHERPSREFGP